MCQTVPTMPLGPDGKRAPLCTHSGAAQSAWYRLGGHPTQLGDCKDNGDYIRLLESSDPYIPSVPKL